MRVIKLGGISVVVLFLLVTGMGLLFPSTARVSRTIDVHAAPTTVLQYLSDFKQWPLWVDGLNGQQAVALQGDSKDGNEGVQFGNSSVRFTLVSDTLIETKWRSGSDKEQEGNFRLLTSAQGDITTVNWVFLEELNWYPWERFGSMINDDMLGPVMERSLANLKTLAEQAAANQPAK